LAFFGGALAVSTAGTTDKPTTTPSPKEKCLSCKNGWVAFEDSCYLLARDMVTRNEARARCKGFGATLFVPNTVDEWNTIRMMGVRAWWSWIGLSWHPAVADNPVWEAKSELADGSLGWLNKAADHGHALNVDCVAHYTAPEMTNSYIGYYGCESREFYICERNASDPIKVGADKENVRIGGEFRTYRNREE